MTQKPLTNLDFATAFGVTPQRVSVMKREGMPTESIEAAKAWRDEREAQRKAVEESRLGVPLFFGLDVVHGHRSIHPVPLAEAGAFDRELWEATARDSAIEAALDGVHIAILVTVGLAAVSSVMALFIRDEDARATMVARQRA